MSQTPTIILVQGSWYPVDCWDKVIALLEAKHFKSVAIALPSAQSNPDATFLDDVTAVRSAIEAEVAHGTDVVVVAHSYGGLPGQSAAKGLTIPKGGDASATTASGGAGHVIGFAMLASGFTMTGMSFLGGLGGKPPPTWNANTETGFAELTVDTRELFFHDLPEEEGNAWVAKLGKQSLKSLAEGGEHAYGAWIDAPSWYLATVEDRGLPFEAQKMFVQMAKDAGADVTMREVQSGHSPMLSKSQETADFIADAAADFVAKKKGKGV